MKLKNRTTGEIIEVSDLNHINNVLLPQGKYIEVAENELGRRGSTGGPESPGSRNQSFKQKGGQVRTKPGKNVS